MSAVPKADWHPSASLETLRKRAQLFQTLRTFFYARQVLEIDPPMLSQAAAPDVHLDALSVGVFRPGIGREARWLPTSPEYPLKRLLCAGYGDVFSLGPVFRDGDESDRHQQMFTLLEWYRLAHDLHAIVAETEQLLRQILPGWTVEYYRYDELFREFADIAHAYEAPAAVFRQALEDAGKQIAGVEAAARALWRQLVLTEIIEPQLAKRDLVFVWGYPAEEAALAGLSSQGYALRFEVYARGLELANGYEELQAAEAYQSRFEAWNHQRRVQGKPEMPVDQHLLAALEQCGGLPACSGVALGVDRLLMVQLGMKDIRQVVPFDMARA